MSSCTNKRRNDVQRCPAVPTAANRIALSARSRSAEGATIMPLLPPSSRIARAKRAAMISTIVGQWDADIIGMLRGVGFLRRRTTRPLYVFSPFVDSVGGLNYFATDLAQRF